MVDAGQLTEPGTRHSASRIGPALGARALGGSDTIATHLGEVTVGASDESTVSMSQVPRDASSGVADTPSAGRVAILRCGDVYELPLRREAEAFRDEGFEVDVIQLAGDDPPEICDVDGVRVHKLGGRRTRNVSKARYALEYADFVVKAARRLHREHKRRPFDLVQVNTMPDFLYLATLPVRLRGAAVSVFMKEPVPELGFTLFESRWAERLLRLVERSALAYADVAFTVTEDLRQTYGSRGADLDKIHVVLNCPDIRHLEIDVEPRADDDRFVLICHGTVEPRYGHDVILDAIKIVAERVPEVQLRIAGKGEHLDSVERRIEQEGLDTHVVSLGWISMEELVAELRGADAGIVCQLSSPYSNLVHTNKMFEYIMVGIPCISARLDAVASSFDADSLLFFEPDDPQSLAEAIIGLHDDPAMGERAVRRARELYDSGYRWIDQRSVLIEESLSVLGHSSR